MIRTIHGFAFLMVLTGVVSAWGLMLVGLNYQLDKRQLLIREEELSRAAASLALLAAKDDRTRGGRGPAGVWVRDMAKLWPYRVSLLNEDGRYEADSRLTSLDRGEESYQTPSEVSGAFADGSAHSRRFSYFLGQEYLYAAARVDYENAPPKVLRMGVSIDDLNQQRRQLLKFYFPVAGVGLALAMLVGWFGTRRLARDYQVINQAAQDLASGDLSHRLALSRLPSELGQTGQALNQLADSLSGQLALAEERQHHLLAVLEAMDEGVLVLDEQGLVTQTNRRLEEMLRLPAVQPGLPLALNIRRPELVADFEAIRRGQQPPPRLIHDHGPPERFIEVRFSPIQGGGWWPSSTT